FSHDRNQSRYAPIVTDRADRGPRFEGDLAWPHARPASITLLIVVGATHPLEGGQTSQAAKGAIVDGRDSPPKELSMTVLGGYFRWLLLLVLQVAARESVPQDKRAPCAVCLLGPPVIVCVPPRRFGVRGAALAARFGCPGVLANFIANNQAVWRRRSGRERVCVCVGMVAELGKTVCQFELFFPVRNWRLGRTELARLDNCKLLDCPETTGWFCPIPEEVKGRDASPTRSQTYGPS
ncbi:Hypothetical predicted protein, partial [Olea europaea subsp. europaea]